MSNETQVHICQRCGRAFMLTDDYVQFLAKQGKKEITPVLCLTCMWHKGQLPKERGHVKWFSSRKHYGFIKAEKGEEIFFHQDQILTNKGGRRPQDGQAVRFHIRGTVKGPEALNVELLEG